MTVRDAVWADLVSNLRILCDSFTLAGTIMLGVGILIFIADQGAFTGLSYILTSVVGALIPGGRLKQKTYAEYVDERKGKKAKGYGFLLISGAAELAAAFIILYFYLKVR